MSQTVIRVDGLGKRYRITEGARYAALRDLIGEALRAPLRFLSGSSNSSNNGSNRRSAGFIWALKDIGFEIRQGEVMGLIGRNGSGKSTLLKILSRITRPTEGCAEIRGRVGSLLEVGTGFHTELTGRENVYMSGAILGMRKAEIDRKFDEIVAFSQVERFLDTPLKHYSSGMQMRLAFAVAAHLDPEILFIDEVLAVGDAEFQKKCLGKMGDISKQGRTIIFVSHNVNAVSSLCRSAILLGDGRIVEYSDDVQKVLRHYLSPGDSAHTVSLLHHPNRTSGSPGVFEEIAIEDQSGGLSQCVLPGANVVIWLKVRPAGKIRDPRVSIGVTSFRGERIFAIGTHIGGTIIPSIEGPSKIRVQFTAPSLVPGEYALDIGFYDGAGSPLDEIYGAAALRVLKNDYLSMVAEHGPHTGHIMVRSDWTCMVNSDANSSELISSTPRSNS
jgi:lipopolysaccharide transport system ATP-binding protein